jgi:hypothetical protein
MLLQYESLTDPAAEAGHLRAVKRQVCLPACLPAMHACIISPAAGACVVLLWSTGRLPCSCCLSALPWPRPLLTAPLPLFLPPPLTLLPASPPACLCSFLDLDPELPANELGAHNTRAARLGKEVCCAAACECARQRRACLPMRTRSHAYIPAAALDIS